MALHDPHALLKPQPVEQLRQRAARTARTASVHSTRPPQATASRLSPLCGLVTVSRRSLPAVRSILRPIGKKTSVNLRAASRLTTATFLGRFDLGVFPVGLAPMPGTVPRPVFT